MSVEKYVIYFEGDDKSMRGNRNEYVASLINNGYCYVDPSIARIKRITPAVSGGQVTWQTVATFTVIGALSWLRTLHHNDDIPYRTNNTNFIRVTELEWARDNYDRSNSIVIGISGYLYVGTAEVNPVNKPTLSIIVNGDWGTADKGWRKMDYKDTIYLILGRIKNEHDYNREVASIRERERLQYEESERTRREAVERERKARQEAEQARREAAEAIEKERKKSREAVERERKLRQEAEQARFDQEQTRRHRDYTRNLII